MTAPSPLRVTVRRRNASTAVILIGRGAVLDLSTKDSLSARLEHELDAGVTHIIVDMSHVTFCDSSGLSALVGAHRKATKRGGWVRLINVVGQPDRILQVTNLDRVLRGSATAER